MSSDHVDLDAQQIANGLAQWDASSSTLQTRWNDLTGQIDAIIGQAPWGTDEPGQNFNNSFVTEGKAGEFTGIGQPIVSQVVETGQNVRTSVEASLGADKLQEAEVSVDVPRFNTGGAAI